MFLFGYSEGSCINPFQEVGRPRLFSQTILKYPDPPPPPKKNVPFLACGILESTVIIQMVGNPMRWLFSQPRTAASAYWKTRANY